MPYELRTEGDRYCVAKKGGEVMKCYDDKGKAVAYLRALWANVHESVEGASLSMHVTKARIQDGKMVIKMTSSDTGKDFYDESMSRMLFDDFIGHIKQNDGIPEPFKSVILAGESWAGGMPYISLAHYKSGADGVNIPGEIVSIGRDGDVLKAVAVLYDTPLGRAVFKSLQKDLVEKRADKVRVSIGFLDIEHSHGEKFIFTRKSLTDKCPLCAKGVGDKIYRKGHLVHLALTRAPANPRTDVEVERSMTTKREDAESIIEDEEVIKGLDLKSQAADDVLVVKMEEEMEDCEEGDEDCKKKKMDKMHKEMSVATEPVAVPVESAVSIHPDTSGIAIPASVQTYSATYVGTSEPTPVEKSLAALQAKVAELKSQGLTGTDALQAIQGDFDHIGEVLKAEFTPPPSPEDVAKQNLETTLRSILGAVLDEKFQQFSAQTVAPIQAELETLKTELRVKSLTSTTIPTKEEETVKTVQRSLVPSVAQKAALEELTQKAKMSSFDLIARQSVGLQ